jgi:high-affinity nickel-transport protein
VQLVCRPGVSLNIVAWSVLAALGVPKHLTLGPQIFGLGIGVTAYALWMRHAFDADHIAAIDNITASSWPTANAWSRWAPASHPDTPRSWCYSLPVSRLGAKFVTNLTYDGSSARADLGIISTSASGMFLYLIGIRQRNPLRNDEDRACDRSTAPACA